MRVKIIAEAGVNHNGDIKMAKELVNAAAKAGADIVKFQTFKAEKLVTKSAEKAQYQKDNCGADESQYDMLKKLELSDEMHFELIEHCNKREIDFLSTAFDFDSLVLLTRKIGLKLLKIPSGEITNGPLIHQHARTKAQIILSTGMSNIDEIETALAVLAHGYCCPDNEINSIDDCIKVYNTQEAQSVLKNKVTLLHCTSNYPASFESVNLKAMNTMENKFSLPIGYSDHTEGILATIAAVARGATIIEKHFTLDKKLPGPDHKASIEPHELTELVKSVRSVSSMLGSGEKAADSCELSTIGIARKSLHAKKTINKGDFFNANNIDILRPGNGISPMDFWKYLNTKSPQKFNKGEKIK